MNKKNFVLDFWSKYKIIFFLLLLFLFPDFSFSQSDSLQPYNFNPDVKTISFVYDDYSFKTKYDTADWCSVLNVKYKNKEITSTGFDGWVDTMNVYDFNGDGKKIVLISSYTGGAHCCVMLFIGMMENGKFYIPDTLFLGNAWYDIVDSDKDGKLEIVTGTDMFAYAFTNYAETRFPPRIYRIKNNKFKDVTKQFPKIVTEYIEELKTDLKEFTKSGFECLGKGEDTFNTDAGSVKTILAAITACYQSIGEVKKGYEIIDKTYKCPDKDKFVKILKDEFKLK
ncbi:MAG: hypothetical protein NTU73_00670 [Ignavibacteriae bacterium]|nr:hypothetical protein [Ignavibacteriota bacterium]